MRSATDEDEVQLQTNGVSILLAKIKTHTVGEKVFRLKGDTVHLPEELFTGKWREVLQSGSVQVI